MNVKTKVMRNHATLFVVFSDELQISNSERIEMIRNSAKDMLTGNVLNGYKTKWPVTGARLNGHSGLKLSPLIWCIML